MATLIKTRRRINSIMMTRKITNAMEMVATVKFSRYWTMLNKSATYIRSLADTIRLLAKELPDDLLDEKTRQNRLIIIVNSNIGLCAGYNNDIFHFADALIKPSDTVIPIGLKGAAHYKNLGFVFDDLHVTLNEKIDFNRVAKFADFIYELYQAKKYQSVQIIHMGYHSGMRFVPKIVQLLPVKSVEEDNQPTTIKPGPVIEPNAPALLKQILPVYLASQIYRALVAAQTIEQASRRNAMKNATDNASDLLTKLKLEYNKARQNAITQEITEVVAGGNN